MNAIKDNGESVSLMEPLVISQSSRHIKELTDMTLELVAKSSGFRSSLPLAIQSALAETVRAVNCYYSNLIEGHDTRPIDIERALQGDYSSNQKKRNLQLEAKAHIEVQKWIDQGGIAITDKIYSEEIIRKIH
jgi:Fic family protein